MTKKFSQFVDGDTPRTTDIVVGLRDDINTQFDFSGVNDQYGNKIVQWQAYNGSGRNYIRFINSPAGFPVAIQSQGIDADVGMAISSKRNGGLDLLAPGSGDINIVIGGSGNINLTTNAGKFILNETTGIDAVLDEDNMVSNSATAVSTQQSTKSYVDTADTVIKSYSYITKTDDTASLPGSTPLSGLASGFLSNTTATGVLNPRTHTGTTNQIDVTNGSGVSGNPTYQLSSPLVTPGSVTLGGDLNIATHKIVSNSGTPIQLIPNNDSDGIDLSSSIVRIDTDLRHAGEPDNKFTFTTSAQTHYIGGSSIYDINASGFRLGMGYRVNAISNDAAAFLDTDLMTAYAIQTAIGNAIIGSNNFRGGWDASGGLFPTTGGTGPAGAVAAGNQWRISVAGTLGGEPVDQGDQIIAATAVPGQTAANWIIVNPRVFSVFGRTGSVVAASGDYTYNQITGLPATATSGKLMRGNGSAWVESTATYPDAAASAGTFLRADGSNWSASTATLPNTAGTSGTLLQSNATGFVNTTAAYPATAGTSGNVLTSNGTDFVSSAAPVPNYNVIAPFLSYRIISGSGLTAQSGGNAVFLNSLGGNADFQYQYFIYLKCGVTYRFQVCLYVNNGCGILQNTILSSDTLTTYNTLSNIDTYSATSNALPTPFQQTFLFSPAGFNAGDWVPCVLNSFCNSKNASSSNKFIFITDGNGGFSFCERYT